LLLFLTGCFSFQRGGTRVSDVVDKVLGRGSFEVDEAFVKKHLRGLEDDDRELMNAFVAQSQEVLPDDVGELRARRALFRIGDVLSKPCDDSPLQGIHNPTPPRMGEFDYNGQLLATDGTRETKLTKLFKRRDNKGKLLDALYRMKLDR
jgi:hypothetical protein